MRIDETNSKHIIADEGKTFRRIGTDEVYSNELWLGYTYQIGGKILDNPHLDTAEDFEEIILN